MLIRLYTLRVVLLVAVLLACVGLTPSLFRALEMNNSLEVWFLEDAPALQVYRDFQEHFGSDEVIIMIYHDEEGIFTSSSLNRLEATTAALDSLPDVANVYGLANVRLLERTPVGLRASLLLDSLGPMEERLATYPWLEEHFLNEDHTATRLLIQLKASGNLDTRRGKIIREIREVAESYMPPPSVALGGVGVIFDGLNEVSLQEFGKFLGLAYLVMFLLLIVLYRNGHVVLLALGVITLSSYITLGFYGLAGLRLNMMSTLVPVILTLLGLIDVIHIVNERAHLAQSSEDNFRKALVSLKNVWRPCLFTTLTTMAGFLSLLLTPMPILRQFGLFSAIGVFLCLIFTYLLGVFFLPRVNHLAKFKISTAGLWAALYQRKTALGILALAWTVASLIGLTRIKVDTYTLGYLPEDHRVVKDHEQILEHWGDYMPLDFLIQVPDTTSVFKGEAVAQGVALTESWMKMEAVTGALSFATFTHAGMEARYGSRAEDLIHSEAAVRSMSRLMRRYYPDFHRYLVDSSGAFGRITLFGSMASAEELSVIMEEFMAIADTTLTGGARAVPSGYLPMYADIINYVAQSQVRSLALALVLIFVLVWLYIGNPRLALIALACNLFPILVMFGALGWFGIDLDLATASIAAIGLSFCIDDSIHFIHEYWQGRKEGLSREQAQQRTFTRIGSAILVSSFVLFTGYSLMSFSALKTVYLFGALTALMVVAALFAQLVIFPALIQALEK